MKLCWRFTAAVLFGAFALRAEVPEILKVVPEARGYELIARLNPLEWGSRGYQEDRSGQISGELKRVAYLLKLSGKDGKVQWVFAAMDPFAKELGSVLVPTENSPGYQTYVRNLEVASNVDGVKTGRFEQGNIEFCGKNYGGYNAKRIPGATHDFDFGDSFSEDGGYGCMQLHNYLEKQTIFAFNNLKRNANCDLGIGNSPQGKSDWTFSGAGRQYQTAELLIAGKFDGFQLRQVTSLNPQKTALVGTTDRNPLTYAPGEPMTFTIRAELGDQKLPEQDYFIHWTRTGDDGKIQRGSSRLSDGPVTIKTSLERPGFVRVRAVLADHSGQTVQRKERRWGHEYSRDITFEGGAGAAVDKISQAVPEPEDFDAFWQKQKTRLAQVPLKFEMKQFDSRNGNDRYTVTVDCAGPRPVTGYLTIPQGAGERSLPARVTFLGYGVSRQWPHDGVPNEIQFTINAHGFELGHDDAFYRNFAESIKSNGKDYAFDPVQNADPEQAYFNQMVLRVLRAVEFVKSLPQWNRKDLIAFGNSQGGLQAIWAAALDPDVSRCESGVTWCCNMAGPEKDKRLHGGWYIKWVPALGYYDAVNHAKRIKNPVIITRAGLGDYTCPPSGLAVLFRNLGGPGKIIWVQGSDHGYAPPGAEQFTEEKK